MKAFLDIPLHWRLAAVAAIGLLVGHLVNLAVYALGERRRRESPWSSSHPRDDRRDWLDRLPLVGWFRMRRLAGELGAGFWIRPIVVELLLGALFAGLYWWEVAQCGILDLPQLINKVDGTIIRDVPSLATWRILHVIFLGHLILVTLMLVASLIDFDERVIPDAVTVTGTIIGLALSAAYTWNLMPSYVELQPPRIQIVELTTLCFPAVRYPTDPLAPLGSIPWPAYLAAAPQLFSLLAALICFWAWCFALLPWLWLPDRGFQIALRFFAAKISRADETMTILPIAICGTAGIGLVWWMGGPHWVGLLTSLAGITFGGGLLWAVRVIASRALEREALGFGDVTLLAMIGSFLGWQACLLVFFLAPFAGLLMGLAQLVLGRGREIPYGPFICLAALGVIVGWVKLWQLEQVSRLFNLLLNPVWSVLFVVVCLAGLAVLLGLYQIIRGTPPEGGTPTQEGGENTTPA